MSSPQPGIFVEGTTNHRFMEFVVPRSSGVEQIRSALSGLGREASAPSDPASPTQTVVALGLSLAERLGLETPGGFRPFQTIGAGDRKAPATPGDLFVWVHGTDASAVFDRALEIRRLLSPAASAVFDVPAFVYRDNRDLTGFIDGTENPEAAQGIAVVADGQPGSGGSVVLVQQWVHDLDRFHALDAAEQERIIGRTKADSVELGGDVMPADSHVSRVGMEDENGQEIEVYRRSVPWGNSTEAGLVFVGFTDELVKLDNMVRSMFGVPVDDGSGDGAAASEATHDRLTDFSVARTGNYFFAPSLETLAALH